jgi:predicted enzyme related to lactoylglutathione lyase
MAKDFTADGPPRFFWRDDDLNAVRQHLHTKGPPVIGEGHRFRIASYLEFRDPEGSPVRVCSEQR